MVHDDAEHASVAGDEWDEEHEHESSDGWGDEEAAHSDEDDGVWVDEY